MTLEIAESAHLNTLGLERLESLTRGYLKSAASIIEAARNSKDEDAALEAVARVALTGDYQDKRVVASACACMAYWALPANEQDCVTVAERDAVADRLAGDWA